MVGNSWIYKAKYADHISSSSKQGKEDNTLAYKRTETGGSSKSDSGMHEVRDERPPEKKKRDKSRTRTIFGLRKAKD